MPPRLRFASWRAWAWGRLLRGTSAPSTSADRPLAAKAALPSGKPPGRTPGTSRSRPPPKRRRTARLRLAPRDQLVAIEADVAAEAHVRHTIGARFLQQPRMRHAEQGAGGLRVEQRVGRRLRGEAI